MNDSQLVDRLHRLDPAASVQAPTTAETEALLQFAIAGAKERTNTAVPTNRSGRRLRHVLISGLAVGVTAVGVGGAAAAGLIPRPVQAAFDIAWAPDNHSTIETSAAELLTTGLGPEGSSISVWRAPITGEEGDECVSVIASVPSAPVGDKPNTTGATCTQQGAGFDSGAALDSLTGSLWLSPTTGAKYYNYAGASGDAATVRLDIPGSPPLVLQPANRWIVFSVPAGQPAQLTALADDGNVITTVTLQQNR